MRFNTLPPPNKREFFVHERDSGRGRRRAGSSADTYHGRPNASQKNSLPPKVSLIGKLLRRDYRGALRRDDASENGGTRVDRNLLPHSF